MVDTIATLNSYAEEYNITEVCPVYPLSLGTVLTWILQPSLMNFCVTDGESVVVTRYISSKTDEAASLVCLPTMHLSQAHSIVITR